MAITETTIYTTTRGSKHNTLDQAEAVEVLETIEEWLSRKFKDVDWASIGGLRSWSLHLRGIINAQSVEDQLVAMRGKREPRP